MMDFTKQNAHIKDDLRLIDKHYVFRHTRYKQKKSWAMKMTTINANQEMARARHAE